jgi:STE24 endopeptidase
MRKLCALLLVIAALGTYAYTFAQATAPPSPPDRVEVPQPTDKAVQYHRTGTYWWVALTLWGFALPLLFLFTGFSAKLRDVATRVGKKWFFVVAIYVTLYAIILFLIDLPVSYVAGYA